MTALGDDGWVVKVRHANMVSPSFGSLIEELGLHSWLPDAKNGDVHD